jgi:hypothetical protein
VIRWDVGFIGGGGRRRDLPNVEARTRLGLEKKAKLLGDMLMSCISRNKHSRAKLAARAVVVGKS